MVRDPFDTPVHTEITVTGTTQVALAANADRRYALFINDSDAVMYIAVGQDAVSGEGIRLNASGGSYEMSEEGGTLFQDVVNVIGGTTKNLLVMEA